MKKSTATIIRIGTLAACVAFGWSLSEAPITTKMVAEKEAMCYQLKGIPVTKLLPNGKAFSVIEVSCATQVGQIVLLQPKTRLVTFFNYLSEQF